MTASDAAVPAGDAGREADDPRPPEADARSRLVEHRVEGRQVYRGALLDVRRDRVRLPDGHEAAREYVVHGGAVLVVPVLDDGRLLVERQYRYPLARVFLEFPAGKIDPGEDRFDCARRELLEETGYVAREWAHAFTVYPTVAYSDEAIGIWFARGLEHRGASLDEGEFLDVISATPQEFLQWCRDGQVQDSKTLASAIWIQNVMAGTWKLDWKALP